MSNYYPPRQGLYDFANEHDACGVGMLANIDGKRTHAIIEKGIQILKRLTHRGAVGSDVNTGDGAGILIQTPHEFLVRVCGDIGITLPEAGKYGVGMLFLPRKDTHYKKCKTIITKAVKESGFSLLGFRDVPTDNSSLGETAKASEPRIEQLFIGKGKKRLSDDAFERKLYVLSRVIQQQIEDEIKGIGDTYYAVSFSSRTLIYKGLLLAPQVTEFYPDLCEKDMVSALAIVHQRYSTNTFPTWALAQPFRYLAHNGEINTLRGNYNQMRARENGFQSELFGKDISKLLPIIRPNQSDSACLDNALEFFTQAGRSLPHAMMMLVPEAWGDDYKLGADLKGFFEYHAGLMEPWDGPAALAFSDGKNLGAMLDRNGLRPARYMITKDKFIVLASEAGVLDIPVENIKEKGRLSPGQMLFVDLEQKRVLFNDEIKMKIARQQPYRRWVEENKITLHGLFDSVVPPRVGEDLLKQQKLFGYTREDINMILKPMATQGHEPTGSMGNDAALAVLSEKPQLLYTYFKQLFAQVTNPPIDPIREKMVMSLTTFIGNQRNILHETPQLAHMLKLKSPLITSADIERLRGSKLESFQAQTFKMCFDPTKKNGLDIALRDLGNEIVIAARNNVTVIILSDKELPEGMVPIPALLAVSAVNVCLSQEGERTHVGLVVETGEAREVMHFALLLGYGATLINPYLAIETVTQLAAENRLEKKNIDVTKAIENYLKSVDKGLLKIMSKMGISTLRSYRGSQIFEAIGLNQECIDKYFPGTASRIGGLGSEEIAKEAIARYENAMTPTLEKTSVLPTGGAYHYRDSGEKHLWTPQTIADLQHAVRTNDKEAYKRYASYINEQEKHLCTLRGLFTFKERKPIPLEDVEPASEIAKRFVTGAMSFGSISKEAHETLAIAMNRIGGMSNSGEGGEDSARYKKLPNGDSLCSSIKQIASGRFGVTAEYLSTAKDLQIKIAQGAKPGEGGQLPGHKVNKVIARVRHSTPGVTLISPPPHHDIYSIEDLAQLIYDLKNANPEARVSVKLVSEVGVGTIAAGVSKGHADMVLIAGHDGGTGASPLTSIKHAGIPWELGLSETQQTLVLNKLRDRIRVQVDGQLKTGRDVIIGALLGAEEFGFATTALVTMGCVMMRKCHSNTCPVGVATQDPELRKRFQGKPEHVINFFMFIAEEVREYLAKLGFATLDEAVGHSEILDMNEAIDFWKSKNLDFSSIFHKVDDETLPIRCLTKQDHGIDKAYDQRLIKELKSAIEKGEKKEIDVTIKNVDRTAGAMLSNLVAKQYGNKGLPKDTIKVNFTGCAGQSFAAFLAHGIKFTLNGEANDYVGKGLSGGTIIIKPNEKATFKASENSIAGNVCLYGATSGEIYINGKAGERFAIRNSGVTAVVEGVGDHCCEYMTGGEVYILGRTGMNFGAGMSGGYAFVYDEFHDFDTYCNLEMVDLEPVVLDEDIAKLQKVIKRHYKHTKSEKAKMILDNWDEELPKFVKVFPMEYRRVLGQMTKEDEAIERNVTND